MTRVRRNHRFGAEIAARALVAAVVLGALGGCGQRAPTPLPGAGGNGAHASDPALSKEAAIAEPGRTSAPPPPDTPPSEEIETGVEVPLKLTGIGSKQELDHALQKIEDPAIRAWFERGFRASFSHDKALRRFGEAIPAMEKVLVAMPNFAPAYRVLAYAHFNTGGGMAKATELYEKAVAADPEYGEAHYALSFMLTQSDMARARTHFDKAMALGVPDERNLREQFFR